MDIEKQSPILKALLILLSIIATVATVFSCVVAYLALFQPQQLFIFLESVSGAQPSPEVVVVVATPTQSGAPAPTMPISTPSPIPPTPLLTTATSEPTPIPSPSPPTPTPLPPTATKEPTPTSTPVGMVNQVFQVEGETATWGAYETGLYIQAGDRVNINYTSGEWWIGQDLNNDWVSQTPTDANGYTGREGERVAALLGVDNPNKCRPLASAPFGSLVGRLGADGTPFLIGNSQEFVAQDSGVLYLQINYYSHNRVTNCPYGDGGVITVRVVVTPP